jgi:hypothetical protein
MASVIESASAASTTATNTVTVTLAGAPSNGELLVAFVHHTDDFPATPSGWTELKEIVTNGVLSFFIKTSDGTEGTSYVFTAPTNGGMTARVMRVSGVGAIDSSASGFSSGTGTFTSGSLVTTAANTFMIGGVGLHATTLPTGDVTPGTGWTNVASDVKSTNASSRKSQLSVAIRTVSSAGTYDYTGTFTPGASTSIEPAMAAWESSDPNGSVTAVRATGSGAAGVPVVVGGGAAGVTAVRATGSGLVNPPTVTGISAGSVTAVRAIGWANALEPSADVITTLTGGGAAEGTGLAYPPTVTSSGGATLQAVRAQGTGTAIAPGIPNGATATTATGSGLARPPAVAAGARVVAVRATGTGFASPPAVTGSASISVTVTAVRAIGTARAGIPGAQMVETLPTNVGTGRVTGRFARAKVLIGDNDGIPNLFPISSAATDDTITFTSTASIWLDTTASPAAVTILPEPIVCTLDSQGYMVDSAGHQYVDLVATNDAQLSPSNRKWTVVFSAGFGIPSFQMVVLESATVDLASLIPT